MNIKHHEYGEVKEVDTFYNDEEGTFWNTRFATDSHGKIALNE